MPPRQLSTLPLPPATLSKLLKAGYESVQDLKGVTSEALAGGPSSAHSPLYCGRSPIYTPADLRVSLDESNNILSRINGGLSAGPSATPATLRGPTSSSSANAFALPLTQSAAELTARHGAYNQEPEIRYSTGCPPIDRLLGGGMTPGMVLEVSGPPGSMKEHVAIGSVQSFLKRGTGVLVVGKRHYLP
jgi:RAD51-like protein 2